MASPVPRCSTCSTNSMAMPGGACSIRVLVTHSARWPTTTTTRVTDSSASASSTWRTMGRPHSRWRGFGPGRAHPGALARRPAPRRRAGDRPGRTGPLRPRHAGLVHSSGGPGGRCGSPWSTRCPPSVPGLDQPRHAVQRSWAYSSHVGVANATRTSETSSPNAPHARPHHHRRPELGDLPGQRPRPHRGPRRCQRAAGRGPGRRRRALRRPGTGSGASCPARERIELLLDRDSAFLELAALAAWGTEYQVGASSIVGHRRGGGGRVPHQRPRPHRPGRRHEPVLLPQGRPGLGHRPAEPAARHQPGRVGRRRPPGPGRAVHPGRAGLPGPHPQLGGGPAHRGPGLRQLHRRRGLRPGHERLHRDDRAAIQGLPRRPPAGQDGHRRGVDRRGAGRGLHARPGLGPGRLPGRRTRPTPSAWAARS